MAQKKLQEYLVNINDHHRKLGYMRRCGLMIATRYMKKPDAIIENRSRIRGDVGLPKVPGKAWANLAGWCWIHYLLQIRATSSIYIYIYIGTLPATCQKSRVCFCLVGSVSKLAYVLKVVHDVQNILKYANSLAMFVPPKNAMHGSKRSKEISVRGSK